MLNSSLLVLTKFKVTFTKSKQIDTTVIHDTKEDPKIGRTERIAAKTLREKITL